MLIANRGPNSDIFLIVSDDKSTFFCLHNDRTMPRTWEHVKSMNVNEAAQHVKMHMQIGHKVPAGIIDKIKVQYLLQD
jgi:hypothetical protein